MGAGADKVLYSELTRFFSIIIVEESIAARVPGDIHRIWFFKSEKSWKAVYSDRKY